MTGLIAFCLLVPLGWLYAAAGPRLDPQIALVGFHTVFNLIGVLAVVGVTKHFARLIIWLIPSKGEDPAERLDDHLLKDPEAALDAARAAVQDQAKRLFRAASDALGAEPREIRPISVDAFEQTNTSLRSYLDRIKTGQEDPVVNANHIHLLHALDHMDRLTDRLRQSDRIETIRTTENISRFGHQLSGLAGRFNDANGDSVLPAEFDALRQAFREERRLTRKNTLNQAANDQIDLEEAIARVDSIRWLHRTTYHLWRISVHLVDGRYSEAPKTEARLEMEMELDQT
jgi:phosphate:Na+ symporter